MIIKNFKKLPSARGITYVFKSEIFCFSQNHLCVIDYNGDVSEKYFVENEKYIVDIVAWDNFIFCSSNSSKFYFIDRLKNSIDVVSKRFISNEIIYNTSIIYFETIPENKNKYKFGYFDFKKKEDYPIGIFSGLPFFFRNEIFHIDGGLLSSYSNKGKVKWKRNIKHLVNNKDLRGKCLGIVGDIKALIISNNTLIGNSKTSGEIKWHVTNFNIKRYQLDENDGKLKGLVSNSYFEIDVVTGDKKRFNLISHEEYIKNEMKTYDGPAIDSYRDNFVIVGDHIITTDSKSGLFGAFNTKTLKFDWWHEEPNVYFPAAKPIRYFDSLLFLLDHRDTLHIYKIEDFSL